MKRQGKFEKKLGIQVNESLVFQKALPKELPKIYKTETDHQLLE
jgi:hypothetical protein